LDEYEDYLLLNTIYSYFKKNKNIMFTVKDISIFFKKNPELCKINEKILQKKVRIKI
jgi:spore coat polysaccharide biosynthesis protein SpsF (cytidylyltransferase family)